VDVPDPSDALEFGTQGISFRARKSLYTIFAVFHQAN
jgi:hypothetical protein